MEKLNSPNWGMDDNKIYSKADLEDMLKRLESVDDKASAKSNDENIA